MIAHELSHFVLNLNVPYLFIPYLLVVCHLLCFAF